MRIHLIVITLCNAKANIKYFTFKKEYSLSGHSWIVRFSFNEDVRVILARRKHETRYAQLKLHLHCLYLRVCPTRR